MVLTDIHNPYYGNIYYGVESSALELDYKILIGNSGFESDLLNQKPEMIREKQISTLQFIRNQMVDGLIASALRMDAVELKKLIRNYPIVLIGHPNPSLLDKFDVISTDESSAAHQIVTHLVEFGHKNIAHITGGTEPGPLLRKKSFLTEMKRQGLATNATIYEGIWSQDAGYAATSEILKQKILPSAIYAANDTIAMGVLARLQEAQINVPGDISVVGYDNSNTAQLKIANLTSVQEPLFIAGRTGFELLINRIENKSTPFKPKLIKIKPELIVRASTGPRRKGK
jgi:DNA-binding LacI/PurR family transcriptional regulator